MSKARNVVTAILDAAKQADSTIIAETLALSDAARVFQLGMSGIEERLNGMLEPANASYLFLYRKLFPTKKRRAVRSAASASEHESGEDEETDEE